MIHAFVVQAFLDAFLIVLVLILNKRLEAVEDKQDVVQYPASAVSSEICDAVEEEAVLSPYAAAATNYCRAHGMSIIDLERWTKNALNLEFIKRGPTNAR